MKYPAQSFEQAANHAENTSSHRHVRKKRKPLIIRVIGRFLSVIGATFLSFFLVFCITGSICAIAATAYVINYMESTTTVSIQEMAMSYSTNIYATDANGELVTLYVAQNAVERIPVDLEEVPQHVRDAFVYGEDERFYSHEGVDYKRTLAAFANLLLNFWDTDQGGSTITQQLVKNLTGDNEASPQRKIREIFRAMQMEKRYNKDEILETYMNYIGFGGAANGVEKAAQKYFGKSVGELSIAEAACLAAIPQSPEVNNPFAGHYETEYNAATDTYIKTDNWINTGREINRNRMEYILFQMYDNGAITFDEYQAALSEKLLFTDTDEYKALHPELEENQKDEEKSDVTSWIVDEAIREFSEYLMEERGITQERALTLIRTGGYQIYTTANLEMQAYVEEKYSDLNNLLKGMISADRTIYYRDLDGDGVKTLEESMSLQSGFVAIDYAGNILCTVGKVGEKTASLGTSYASTEPQQPGSAIKPISTYGYTLENDLITWGTMALDAPPLVINNKKWPTNYSSSGGMRYSNTPVKVFTAIQHSYNTIPALLCKTYGLQNIYNYATKTVGLSLNPERDIDYAPLAVGGLSYGVTVEDMVNAYMVYGNGGYFSDAHIINRVESGDGGLIYAGGDDYASVISPETSYVMNMLLQNVVARGTGTAAKINGVPLAGKTGTTSDWFDLEFMCLNPDFVSGVWIGYPENKEIRNHGSISSARIWKNIMREWLEANYSGAGFPECDTVIKGNVCATTGKIAVEGCPSAGTGYWKSSNAPYCDGVAHVLQ